MGIQALHHEKSTLEAREVTKLHYHDLRSSNDEFSSYSKSIKRIYARATTHLRQNKTLDLYPKGATVSKFIHEGRPTTTKPTFVVLPSLTSHSTFYECSRSILCQPQHPPHRSSTRLGVIVSYSLHLERKITLPSTSIISPYVYSEPSNEPIRRLYGVPRAETYLSDHCSNERQEASISSQSVEYCLRYKHQSEA